MPSADPLPKPPVIVRRNRRPGSGAPNRPGGAAHPGRGPADTSTANGARRKLGPADDTSSAPPSDATPATVTTMCREFRHDEPAYLAWVDAHPHGLVLNQPRSAPTKAPTLHRIGCAALAPRKGAAAAASGSLRVCGPSADALSAWSVDRGTGEPTACRRCRP